MKVLIAFVLVVIVGSMWETQRDRRPSALPLFALSVVVAAGFFGVIRFL
jgi:hypothetical protein